MCSQPSCHPSHQQDSTRDKGSDIQQGVDLVPAGGLGLVGQDEQLSGVEEDGVDLYNERQGAVGDVFMAGDRQTQTEDDTTVVDQELVGAPLPVVYQHVHGVVQEVANREAD